MTARDATAMLALVVVMTGNLLLVLAGVHTVRQPRPLLAALLAHRLFPARLVFRRSVRLYGAGLLAVGGAGVAGAIGGHPRIGAAGAGLAYAGFALYLAAVRSLRGPLPCGCWGPEGRADVAAVVRSLAFVFAAAVLAGLEPHLEPAQVTVLACVSTIAVALLAANRTPATSAGSAGAANRPARGGT